MKHGQTLTVISAGKTLIYLSLFNTVNFVKENSRKFIASTVAKKCARFFSPEESLKKILRRHDHMNVQTKELQ